MRKLLLVLFLFTLTSNALAEDEKWAYITVWKLANGQLEVMPNVWTYESQGDCERQIIETAHKNNLKVETITIDNVIKLTLDLPYLDEEYGNIIIHHSCGKINLHKLGEWH